MFTSGGRRGITGGVTAVPLTLKDIPLFSGLDEQELTWIANKMSTHHFGTGELLIRQDTSHAVAFFVIKAGEAEVLIDGVPKRTLTAGDYFGEIALLTGSRRTATVKSKTEVDFWGIGKSAFRGMLDKNPALASKLREAAAALVADD